MAEATETEMLRVGGIEVVDRLGNVRVRIGYLGEGDDEMWGVAVRDDRTGRGDRLSMVVEDHLATLFVSYGGNNVATFGVDAWGEPSLWMEGGEEAAE